VAGSCEYGDESSGFDATELVIYIYCNKFAGFYFTMEVYYTQDSIHNC
jgi:hypothetical protein